VECALETLDDCCTIEVLPVAVDEGADWVIVIGTETDSVNTCTAEVTVVPARECSSPAVEVLLSAFIALADAGEDVCMGTSLADEISVEAVIIAAAPCTTDVVSSLGVKVVLDSGLEAIDARPCAAAATVDPFNGTVDVLD
jgi:hypothetical protein